MQQLNNFRRSTDLRQRLTENNTHQCNLHPLQATDVIFRDDEQKQICVVELSACFSAASRLHSRKHQPQTKENPI